MRTAIRAGRLTEPFGSMSPEQVFRRYRGFDGVVWPVEEHPRFDTEDGLADPNDRAAVEEYLRNLPRSEECDLLLIARPVAGFDEIGLPGWSFAGIDVGSFESEWSHYSVVLNQVIWGRYPELRAFVGKLGGHLLFESLKDAECLVAEHNNLRRTGKDVEQGRMEPIAVFLPS